MTLDTYNLPPKISLSEKRLTVILARDEALVCAFCPELDLVTEMATPNEHSKICWKPCRITLRNIWKSWQSIKTLPIAGTTCLISKRLQRVKMLGIFEC